jgi:serine protease Do
VNTLTRLAVAVTVSGLVFGAPLGWGAAAQARAATARSDSRGTQGYLGVDVRDVDAQRAAALKLQAATGAEITSVDHDAPAGKVGLRVHDVILAMNGETIEGEARLRRLLRETPAGRTIQLKIWRDGKQQGIAVQLADRAQVLAEAWPQGQIVVDGFPGISINGGFPAAMLRDLSPELQVRQLSLLGGGGLDVEPIGKQLAVFFGVPHGTGLLVRQVAPNGDGAAAGLKAGDVITKANGQPAETLRAWMMVMAQNHGKPVQLKVIRNHKEQMLNYTPGGTKKQSELELPEFDGAALARSARAGGHRG